MLRNVSGTGNWKVREGNVSESAYLVLSIDRTFIPKSFSAISSFAELNLKIAVHQTTDGAFRTRLTDLLHGFSVEIESRFR